MHVVFSKKILPLGLLLLGQMFFPLLLPAAEVLERRVSVHFLQTPLKDALAEVARQGQFEWSYHASIIAGAQPVTLSASNWTVRETLYALLGEGYEFKPINNYLILKKRHRQPDMLSGYVTDPGTGQRLANATVYDRHSLRAATTDENGYYELKKTGRKAEIVVAKLGYRDTVLEISSASPRFQKIELQGVAATQAPKESPFLKNTYTQVERFFSATLDRWNALNVPDSLHRRFQISLLPSIGSNHRLSGQVDNDWSLNILSGHSRSVRVAEVGGLGNFTHENVDGVQVGGLFNFVHGDNRGVQVAGVVNTVRDTLQGIQIAGLVNKSRHSASPSLQVAGVVNTAEEGSANLQIAGLVNTTDTLQGIQIAALVNHARHARGLQLGLINTANDLDGLQIGLLNRSGRRWLPLFNW